MRNKKGARKVYREIIKLLMESLVHTLWENSNRSTSQSIWNITKPFGAFLITKTNNKLFKYKNYWFDYGHWYDHNKPYQAIMLI